MSLNNSDDLSNSSTQSTSSCGDIGQRGTQFGEQLGISVANLLGFGSLIEKAAPTPLDKLQSQISKSKSSTQQLVNSMSLKFATLQGQFDKNLIRFASEFQNVLEEESALHDEILREKISTNSLYIACIFTIIILIWLFILIK